MAKSQKKYAQAFFQALRDPADERFELDEGQIGEEKAYFITAETKDGENKPVALVLTDPIRELIGEALEVLYGGTDEDEDDLEDEDDEESDDEDEQPRRRRSAFAP